MDLTSFIRDIPDFPKPGIVFKDITPLLKNPEAFSYVTDKFCEFAKEKGAESVAAIESRGFIFAGAVAEKLKLPFVLIRKKGKLPYKTVSQTYDLEYGEDTIEMHEDAIEKGQKVVLIDDLIATGGSARAACDLIEKVGGEVCGITFLIDLTFLEGLKKLEGYEVLKLIEY